MIKLLSKYMKDIDWKILLSMNEDMTFNVTLLPLPKVKDEALKDVAPAIIKQLTIDEVENMTSATLNKAFTKVQSVVSNVVEFEKGIEEQEKLTKMVKLKREAAKTKKEHDKKVAKEAAPSMFAESKVPAAVEEALVEVVEEAEVELDI